MACKPRPEISDKSRICGLSIGDFISSNKAKLAVVFIGSAVAVICSVAYPYGIKWLTDDVLIKKDIGVLGIVLSVMLTGIVCELSLNFVVSYMMTSMSQTYIFESKQHLLKLVLGAPSEDRSNSSMQTLFATDYEKVGDFLVEVITTVVSSVLAILVYLTAMVSLNPILAATVLISIPLVVGINVLLGNYVQRQYFSIQEDLDQVSISLTNMKKGLPFIRAFNAANEVIEYLFYLNQKLRKHNVRYVAATSYLRNGVAMLSIIAPFVILVSGSLLVVHGTLSVGALMATFTFSSTIFSPVASLIGVIPTVKELSVSFTRINKCIRYYERARDRIMSEAPQVSYIRNHNDREHHELSVSNLVIGYNDDIVHSPITYRFADGITYILGGNGSGKSTLGKTLAGGLSSIDGDIITKNVRQVSYIPSNEFLFDGTVYHNLTIGLSNVDEEKLKNLIKIFQLKVPLDLTVHDGHSLSTGEVQKIKLIRSLLGQSEVLIIDEVISNLSKEAQKSFYTYVNRLKNRIILVIDHNIPQNFEKRVLRL